jgi:hypothetical protein
MAIHTVVPDLQVALRLDAFAPRAARYYVGQVDRPSPDLRDAVVLLTSELVSRAVEQCGGVSRGEQMELRAWMPPDVVRVELRAPRELLDPPSHAGWTHYDLLLLDQVADRWAIDTDDADDGEQSACMWFEIDRNVSG